MSYFSVGIPSLPCWSYQGGFGPEEHRRSDGPDSLRGEYVTQQGQPEPVPGGATPGYPGMINAIVVTRRNGSTSRHLIDAEGTLSPVAGAGATKLLSRGEDRAAGPTFTTWTERKITWHAQPKNFTAAYATGLLTCPAHAYPAATRVVLVNLTGGTGLSQSTLTSNPTVYLVAASPGTDTLSLTTLAGAAVTFSSDVTAGQIVAADFFEGTVHPDFPAMYLTQVRLSQTAGCVHEIAECTYTGMRWNKCYRQTITCDGQVVSPSDPIYWNMSGGWNTPERASVMMPEIVVIEEYVTTNAAPTNSVPGTSNPVSAPSVLNITVEGNVVRQWPSGWGFHSTQVVDSINAGRTVKILRNTYKYLHPYILA